MQRSALRAIAPAALAAAALVLAGCTASDPAPSASTGSTGAAAEADGAFTLYAGRSEDLVDPLIEQFEESSGIDVDVRYASSTELEALLLEEGDRSPADVFWSQDAGSLGAVAEAGMLATLPEEITGAVPAEFTSTDGSWVGVTGRARVIAYDSEDVAEAEVPTAIADLTGEEYRGRVAFAPGNASFQSFVTAMRVLEGEEAAAAWVEAIAANEPILTESNGQTLDLVQSGEADFGLINHYYWFEDANELGADQMRAQLAFLPGDPGGIVNVTGAGLLASAEGDPDALAFIEHLVSAEAQEYFVTETFEYPLVDGVEPAPELPAIESLAVEGLDLADLASLADTQALLAEHGLL
ncbi:extracellular solute-binding protein [Agrococcus sediminis]|uniref:extracellular solute-binding protein n=1 Tax=Agrococcus sediminis TaxID=2599924 RepID=UPI001CEC9865|nr:extracellular solute-binding protein [Agrococcus sediminis]